MSLTSVNKLENNTVELVVSVSEEQFPGCAEQSV